MNQSATNVMAAIKREIAGTPGVAAASGAGAMRMRILDSPGMRLDYGQIASNERRPNAIRAMGRLGGKSTGGSFNAELTSGGFTDDAFSAILRNPWTAASAVLQATFGVAATITTSAVGANTLLTFSAGDPIALGYRVGDIITPSGITGAIAAINNTRLRVVAVTTSSITVAGSLVVGVSDGAWTLTILKKLVTPTNVVSAPSYSLEQYDEGIDLSELFLGSRLVTIALSFRPNSVATITYTFVGMDRTALVVGTSPWFTDPSETTGQAMIADDSAIRFNGGDVAKFTSLDLTIAIANSVTPVIGSRVVPDVFLGDTTISGSISVYREDFAKMALLDAETEFELSALFTEPDTAPVPAFGLFAPRVKFGGLDAPFLGGEGPKIETLPLWITDKALTTGYDQSALNVFSSAA